VRILFIDTLGGWGRYGISAIWQIIFEYIFARHLA